jgi:hypothetical protein
VGTFARSFARPPGERHVILAGYQRSIRQICRSPYIEPATSLAFVGMTGIARYRRTLRVPHALHWALVNRAARRLGRAASIPRAE